MPGDVVDNAPLELATSSTVLDKGAVIAGSVTISVGDIDLIQLDLTLVLTAIETVRTAERRRREAATDSVASYLYCVRSDAQQPEGVVGHGRRASPTYRLPGRSSRGLATLRRPVDVTVERLRAHDAVCAAALTHGDTPLPIRFGQSFADEPRSCAVADREARSSRAAGESVWVRRAPRRRHAREGRT
jgi:hypothetical protein